MSETPPEAPPRQPSTGKLGVWGKKLGPMPAWAWAAILLGAVIVFMYYRNKSSGSTSGTSTSTADNSAAASQVPQFVNQTYTTVTPPTSPGVPPSPVDNQIPGHTTVQATGKETLEQIASKYGTTPADIVAFSEAHKVHISPTEARFFKHPTGKVPKGIILWVPEKQVTNITGPGSGEAGQ